MSIRTSPRGGGTGHELTPSQTVGPYLALGLPWPDGPDVVPGGTPGAVTIGGTVYDGAGEPVADAMIETWQADPAGRFDHPDDPRGAREPTVEGFRAFGRAATDGQGHWSVRTVLPGELPVFDDGPDGSDARSACAPRGADARSACAPRGADAREAPHIDVSVFARGLLDRLVTRIYFPEFAEANATDPLLSAVPAERRDTLVAVAEGPGRYRFDIRLRGAGETVFLQL